MVMVNQSRSSKRSEEKKKKEEGEGEGEDEGPVEQVEQVETTEGKMEVEEVRMAKKRAHKRVW